MDSSGSDQENNNYSVQNASRNRKLKYREMLNQIDVLNENGDLGLDTVKEVGNILKKVNLMESECSISKRYQYPEETLLESEVLASSSTTLVKCLEAVDVNDYNYVPSEFASAIMSHCKGDQDFAPQSLIKLLPDTHGTIPELPNCSSLYGAYDTNNLPQPKERRAPAERQKETCQKKAPEKVATVESEEAGIEETVKTLYEILYECYASNNQEPINYYDFIVDTSSFSNTVENAFYFSFLVRDGRATVDLDGKRTPIIKPIKKAKLKESQDSGMVNSQIIPSISIPQWELFQKPGYIQKFKDQKGLN